MALVKTDRLLRPSPELPLKPAREGSPESSPNVQKALLQPRDLQTRDWNLKMLLLPQAVSVSTARPQRAHWPQDVAALTLEWTHSGCGISVRHPKRS